MTGSDLGLTTGAQPAPKVLVKGTSSFKLLQECPIAIVLVVQTFRSTVQASVRVLVPLMIEGCLRLQAAPQRDARTAAVAKGSLFIGVAPGIKNHALYGDLIGTQVKMMSFLAYVIKPYADLTRPYYEELPGISVRLLQDCPPDASATRKELLVAIRHLLSTEMRSFFISQVDTLLDDRVMTGTGVTSRESLRPLAVSMLADLLHHIRPQLSFAQICRVVQLHVQILHHPTLAPSIQTMCIKLLLNITDQSVMRGPEDPGPVLQSVIDALVEKLGALPQLKEGIEAVRKAKAEATEAGTPGGADAVLTPLAIERARTVPASAMLPDLAVHESFKGEWQVCCSSGERC
jgi:transformation/transcription domain-associated protein